MNYDSFRRAWEAALRAAGLLTRYDHAEDTAVLGSMSRRYALLVGVPQSQPAEPFTGSMELSWEWDALLSARTRTTESDLLTELHGRDVCSPAETERPWLRVDLKLHGKLAQDSPQPLASPEVWRAWVAEVVAQVRPLPPSSDDEFEDDGFSGAWLGEPEAHVRCDSTGELWLLGVALEGWQAIVLPRQWDDDPDGVPDEGPEAKLEAFATSLASSLAAWKKALKLLLPSPTRFH